MEENIILNPVPYEKVRSLCHKVKEGDENAINTAAKMLAKALPKSNVVLIPVPGHTGKADYTLKLAKAIRKNSDTKYITAICSCLRSNCHESLCEAKHQEKNINHITIKISFTDKITRTLYNTYLQNDFVPVLVDNVIDTGKTMRECIKLIPKGQILTIGDTGCWKQAPNKKLQKTKILTFSSALAAAKQAEFESRTGWYVNIRNKINLSGLETWELEITGKAETRENQNINPTPS